MLKKIKNIKGFTLTEVMIAIMVLTVAIVSATNLLVGLIGTNQNNLTTLQAYYLAQEGLEAVRNIRDTNWLHNMGWLGEDSTQLWGGDFEIPQADDENFYAVNLEYAGFSFNVLDQQGGVGDVGGLSTSRPWSIDDVIDAKIFKNTDGDNVYLGPAKNAAEDTGFKRTIIIKKYNCGESADLSCLPEDENKYVLVQSKIQWNLGAKERELTLSEVLTDWKGGAL